MNDTNEKTSELQTDDDYTGIVNIIDADDGGEGDLLARLSRTSAVIQEPDGREYITLKAAEAYTGYSNQTLRQYYKKGKIKGIKKQSAFGDTIYLDLEGVKTFRSAVNAKKAAKMDSAELALEVSDLISGAAGNALVPIMDKINAIEIAQTDILTMLSSAEDLSEKLDKLTEAIDEIRENLGITGEKAAAGESSLEDNEASENEENSSPEGEEIPENTDEASPEISHIPENIEKTAPDNTEKSSFGSAESEQLKQLMEDYREMKETIMIQQEYIERQKNRTFWQRVFNKDC